jgi:hypothetical protein
MDVATNFNILCANRIVFVFFAFSLASFLTYKTLDAGRYWEHWIGFPFNVCLVSSGDCYFLGWRYLTLDLYAWTACYLVVWWIAKFARNKFRRKEAA